MTLLKLDPREVEILFDYFDMDDDGEINEYELICALAMVVHSSLDLSSELIFKLYDFIRMIIYQEMNSFIYYVQYI